MKKFIRTLRLFITAFLSAPSVLEINASSANTCPTGHRSFLSDAALATRHALVKKGSDENHVAIIAAASNQPLGICQDEASAAEEGMSVAMLGSVSGSILGVAGEAIGADVDVYSKGDGTLGVEPTSAGTYWLVGRSVKAQATSGEPIEFRPCLPLKVIVLAAPGNANSEISGVALAAETSTNGTAAAASADLAALAAEAEKIGDDVRDVRAKFATLVTKLEELADDFRARVGADAPALVKVLS